MTWKVDFGNSNVVVELYEDGDEWKCTIHFFLVAKAKQWTFFQFWAKKGT